MLNRFIWCLSLGLLALLAACAQPAPSFDAASEGESIVLRGRVIRLVSDDFDHAEDGSRVHYVLETHAGERIALSMDNVKEPLTASDVVLEGARHGATFVVTRAMMSDSELGIAQQALRVEGTRRVAILLFNFAKDTDTPFTGKAVQDLMFGAAPSSSAYFAEQSFGRVKLEGRDSAIGEVYGWHTIAADPVKCEPQLWQQQARALAAANDGVNFADYDHIVMYFPTVAACPWAGLAESPGKLVWIQGGALTSSVFEHELLHNFGIHHANVLRCKGTDGKASAISGQCREEAYADPFDPMGYGGGLPPAHTNGKNKAFLGWIPEASVAYVTSSGDYTLHPLEEESDGLQVLAIPLGDRRYYWLDFRQLLGTDATNFKAAAAIVNGVGLRVSGAAQGFGATGLIDTLPLTKTVDDSAVTVGTTYTDAQHGIRITTLSITNGVASVRVQIGDDPVPAPPAVAPEAAVDEEVVEADGTDGTPDSGVNDGAQDAGVEPPIDRWDDEADAGDDDTSEPARVMSKRTGPVTADIGCQVGARSAMSNAFSFACVLAGMALLRRMRR